MLLNPHEVNLDSLMKLVFISYGSVVVCYVFLLGLRFLAYLNEVENDRPIIILLTHARIKEGQGKSNAKFVNCDAHQMMSALILCRKCRIISILGE